MDVEREDLELNIGEQPTPRSTPLASGWTPLAGDALLDRLRVTGRPRPPADAERVARLRETIEHGLCQGAVATTGCGGRPIVPGPPKPLVVTKDLLTRALDRESPLRARSDRVQPPTVPMACGVVIDALFRQLVTTGAIGDPMRDAVEALVLDDRHGDLVTWIDNLSVAERGALTAEVDRQSADLVHRWPRLDPSWLPRTQVPMRVGLARGAIELSGRVDLAIGRPGLNVASVAILEVKSGARRPEHRKDLHFYALVETLRNPAPPFAVATYYTRTGELDVDPVSDELLASAARRTVAGIGAMCRPHSETVAPGPATRRPGKGTAGGAGGRGRQRMGVTARGGAK
ncbi:MAG TPA: hypothetical protein VND67_10350 [Acidimicrobiales bacterium]|nr:hypothetical protein [Acidimicrobiales bacterium]